MAGIPRNVRNNNPGNIRISKSNDWDGAVKGTDTEFETFATPEMGVRAMVKTLHTYQSRYNDQTVSQIISRWAPPNENDTSGYIEFVSKSMGVDPNTPVDLKNNPALTKKLVNAMIQKEGGVKSSNFFDSHVSKGIALASNNNSVVPEVPDELDSSAGLDTGLDAFGGTGNFIPTSDIRDEDAAMSQSLVPAKPSFASGSFSNMKEVLNFVEENGDIWDNELDTYENYSYNVELFIVPENVSREFLAFGRDSELDFKEVINDEWPGNDVSYITIAKTATTTEFSIDNLQIDSRAAGSGNALKMVGLDVSLSFDITQIGNTNLSDSLMAACTLMGYPLISQATFYFKITYKGYEDGNPENSDKLPITKVVPFRLSKLIDLATTTNSSGTVTSLEGNILSATSTYHDVNTTKIDVQWIIGTTLEETLQHFVDALNKAQNPFAGYNEDQQMFTNSYAIEYSESFENFKASKMNGIESNKSSASNDIDERTNGINISKQIGQITPGISVIDILYDMCIQSLDVRKELLAENDAFNKVIRIIPEVIPKENGYNVLTGTYGVDVKYVITMHEEVVIQNQSDQVNRISTTRKLLEQIFDRKRCRKVYYHDYTGLNDQILDLTISLDRQLQKTYRVPEDSFAWNVFLKPGTDLKSSLDADQLKTFNDINKKITDLAAVKDKQSKDVDKMQNELVDLKEDIFIGVKEKADATGPFEHNETNPFAGLDQNFDDPNFLSKLKSVNPEIFDEVTKGARKENFDRLRKAIDKATGLVNGTNDEINELQKEADILIQSQLGAKVTQEFEGVLRESADQVLQGVDSTGGLILLEELGSDFISSKLDNKQFSALMDVMMLNPVTFTRAILPRLHGSSVPSAFKSSDMENLVLARSKFNESLDADMSMHRLSMTIKGDPFWSEYYMTTEKAKEIFNKDNSNDEFKSYQSKVNGSNFMMLVVNKAAGVDEFDNIQIEELDVFVYQVNSVLSMFSRGHFTQQLECVRMPIPVNFAAQVDSTGSGPTFGFGTAADGEFGGMGPNNDGLFDFGTGGEFAGVTNRIGGGRGSDPSAFGDLFGRGIPGLDAFGGVGAVIGGANPLDAFGGAGELLGIAELGRGGALDPRIVAENSFNRMSGGLSSLATVISESSLPTSDQASRLSSLLNEAQMASNFGSTSATASIANIKSLMQDTFGTPAEASEILQELTDIGEIVSPELIAMLNTQVYEDETVTAPTGVDTAAVIEVMSEIENINNLNTSSVDEIAFNVPAFITPVVNTDSTNTTAPSKLELSNSNMMLDGTLPLESTTTYKSTDPVEENYDSVKLENSNLPEDVKQGYKDVVASNNGIKVRKYLDSLPANQAAELENIDNNFTEQTNSTATAAEIAATPLKTPREAIMQSRIEDTQRQMIAEAGGSYNDLSSDEKRHYENLSDAYDDIDVAAQMDPIRNESKLIKITDELDKSIRIYNDKLSGGDSEWSWNEEEAETKQKELDQAKQNVADLALNSVSSSAERVRVNEDGSTSTILNQTLPTEPTQDYKLPINTIINSNDPTFVPTSSHIAQYEVAQDTLRKISKKQKEVEITIVSPFDGYTYQGFGVSERMDPALTELYGYDSGVFTEGETVSEDDPRFNWVTTEDWSTLLERIAEDYPLVSVLSQIPSDELSEETKLLKVNIGGDSFIIIEGNN